ncbi:MAG: hypothetical protein FWG66_08225 [Spirochaetes bacterium]|nr:hypothetical protein [Spirochaetota bacterium]
MAAAVKQAGSKITFTGCINNPVTLGQGNPAMIREEVESNIKSGIRLISPECALPASIPGDNLKCLVETAHRLRP